jgi:hypothetical protein
VLEGWTVVEALSHDRPKSGGRPSGGRPGGGNRGGDRGGRDRRR